ncbi:MAG: hypothetical protein ACTSYM_12010 [Candidatus Baldrarchaeia archaeon]
MSDAIVAVRREVVEEIIRRLNDEFEFYKMIIEKFRKRYGCDLEELEKKIKREGVPVDKHEIWEDSIEWRNAVEEIEKLRKLLRELKG